MVHTPLPRQAPLPGAPEAPAPADFAALSVVDSPAEWSAFSRETGNAGEWESNVVIEGMHCAACAMTVENTLRQVPGVLSARVSAASQRARVLWSQAQVLPSAWMGAVQAAALLEVAVFAVVDPLDIRWQGAPVPLSPQGIYTLAFFVFWGVTLACSALTALLGLGADEVNG